MVKGQRTKGNTKPSSSGRTAQLLGTSEAANAFIGFSVLSSNNENNEEEDVSLDSDVKVVLKKMSKKDCVTKVKALQEFSQLIKDKPELNFKPILNHWTRIYCKLAIDNDWRVREAAHKSLDQLMAKVGRNMAPFLKQLIPIWFTSQFDCYSPAATAALNSFNNAFPVIKKTDVLVFTKQSVIDYINDMLLNQTIQTVGDLSATADENQSKYNRLISNCLQGLSSLISSLPSDSLKECEQSIEVLVNDNKFWKFAKSKEASIRSSFYQLISCFGQFMSDIFISNASKICALSLGCLDESDPLVAASVWECALFSLIKIDNSWKYVNFKKAFYPQFRNILKEGGRGNASTLFPNLLPLISRIPHETVDDMIKFHKEFYEFLREGVAKTVSKQNESNAIIKAFMECLRYSICSTNIENEDQRKEFHLYLIENELLLLLKESLSGSDSLSKSSLYHDIGLLWMYFIKGNNNERNYQNLIQIIIDRTHDLCYNKIEESDDSKFSRISNLFLGLFSNSKVNKSDRKLRFRRESDEDLVANIQKLQLNDLSNDSKAQDLLNKITLKVIDSYNSDHSKICHLELSIDLFKLQTIESFSLLIDSTPEKSIEKFWKTYLKNWFPCKRLSLPTNQELRQIKAYIDLTLILNMLTTDKAIKFFLLDEISRMADPYILDSLFACVCNSNDKYFKEWLKSENAGKAVVNEASNLIHHSIESGATSGSDLDILWRLISHCFSTESIGKQYVEEIIDKFRISLQNSHSVSKTETLVSFTCRLAQHLFASYELCTNSSSARSLLSTIFSLSCRFADENKQLLNAWKSGVKVIIESNGSYLGENGIITNLALEIRSQLKANIKTLENAEFVSICAYELINTIHEEFNRLNCLQNIESQDSPLSNPNIVSLLELMFLSNSEWKEFETKCELSVIQFDWLNSCTLFSTNNMDMKSNELISQSFEFPLIYSAISTGYLLQNLSKFKNELNDELIEVIATQSKHLLISSFYMSSKSQLLKDKDSASVSTTLREVLMNIIESFGNKKLNNKIIESFLESSIIDGNLDTQALGYFTRNFVRTQDYEWKPSLEKLEYNEIITFQKMASNLDQKVLTEVCSSTLNRFICCEDWKSISDGIGNLAILHSCLENIDSKSHLSAESAASLMDLFCGLKESNIELFFYQKDIETGNDLQFCCLIVDTLTLILRKWSNILSQSQWDLILCSTTSWIINSVRQSQKLLISLSAIIFTTKALNLVQVLNLFFDDLSVESNTDKYPENLLLEWREFHSKNIFGILVPYYIQICENEFNFYGKILMNYFSSSLNLMPDSVIPEIVANLQIKEALPVQNLINNKSYEILYLPEDKEKCLNNFCTLVINKYQPIAITSHTIALKMIPFMLTEVTQPEINREEEEILLSPPKSLLSLLQQTDNIVDSLLSEFLIGDCCCVVEPQTDSFTYTLAYLLVWVEILEIFSNINDETKSQFAAFLRQSSYLSRLLENLFRLMPLSSSDNQSSSLPFLSSEFSKPPTLSSTNDMSSADIQKLSCYLYFMILRRLPAAVRQWWNNLDRKTSDVVNKYTSSYFSGVLCLQELEAVQKEDISNFKNMTVKARPSAREVLATYSIEDITIELLIQLPQNHPLGPVSVDSGKRVGVSSSQWRTWLLQLTTFLTHQNGSILDGLILWKRNIDKRFEGIDECMICFYVLHGATYQLPRLQCKYCRKRYHSACLYKWFSTSNNSTCPLCRNLF